MTPRHTTPEPWRDILEAILGYKTTAQDYFRYETVADLAITRLYHEIAPDVAAQQALSAAVFQLLDETMPSLHNAARLFHLIRAVGALKPAMGLNLLQKLLRENTFWRLKQDDVVLHTLLLAMAGEYYISPSFAEWIRADCAEKSNFDHTLVGFSALANQEITRVALWLLERAIGLAAVESQAHQLARELMGLSHPYADLYNWIRELRTRNPDLFEKSRRILGDYLLPWTDRLEAYREPYQILLNAEIFAGRKRFSMNSIQTIASTQIEVAADSAPTTLDLLYAAQQWRTNYHLMSFSNFLHIQGGPEDLVILEKIANPQLFELLLETAGIEIDPDGEAREMEPAAFTPPAGFFWAGPPAAPGQRVTVN